MSAETEPKIPSAASEIAQIAARSVPGLTILIGLVLGSIYLSSDTIDHAITEQAKLASQVIVALQQCKP